MNDFTVEFALLAGAIGREPDLWRNRGTSIETDWCGGNLFIDCVPDNNIWRVYTYVKNVEKQRMHKEYSSFSDCLAAIKRYKRYWCRDV